MDQAKQTDGTQGVYYETRDYAGLGRRLLIVLIDLAVLVGLWNGLARAPLLQPWSYEVLFMVYPVLCFLYMVGLKLTPMGTIGYLLTGVRLVDMWGRRVAFWRAAYRFMFAVFGPFNQLFDILWLDGDPNRQSVRDKLAGTYVIRKPASPIGQGALKYRTYFMLGWSFVFREVERPAEQ